MMSRWIVIAALAALSGHVLAQPAGARFQLGTTGCPMVHCDARLSDLTNSVSPARASLVAVDSTTLGTMGLGCVSNSWRVACSYMGNPKHGSNLVVYDADGRRLWDDQGQLGPMGGSVPMLGRDGTVIASDSHWIMRVDPAGAGVLWKSAKPTGGQPLSPVPVGSDAGIVLLATIPDADGRSEVSTWDPETGAMLSSGSLQDATTGRMYYTRNTPVVKGARAYIVGNAFDDSADGRLFAIDVCESDSCGGRGIFKVAWQYAFTGPSGASPLRIGSRLFFDGRTAGGDGGVLMAVDDGGKSGRLAWRSRFSTPFRASPARDPRGGLWTFLSKSPSLLRLDQANGAVLQEVTISNVLGLAPGYWALSALTISAAASGEMLLTLGAMAPSRGGGPNHIAVIDVSSTPQGKMIWKFALEGTNSAMSQFPIVAAPSGALRVIAATTEGPTLFIGEP